jgi:HAD superfamily hydrolase (TIGR01509 family)
MIKGVLFDFDGTIVDSEPSRFWSTNKVLSRYGVAISEEEWNRRFRRIPSLPIFRDVLDKEGITADAEELYQEAHTIREAYEQEEGVPIIRGFQEFHNFLSSRGIPMVICSGGTREHVRLLIRRMGLPELPIISREDYSEPKPSPDCYLQGLKYLGVSASEVVAFDDAYTGIQAAKDAGCEVVAINAEYEEGVDELGPLTKVHSYKNLDFAWLLGSQ